MHIGFPLDLSLACFLRRDWNSVNRFLILLFYLGNTRQKLFGIGLLFTFAFPKIKEISLRIWGLFLWIHERVSFRAMRESKRDLKGKEKEFNSKQRLVRPVISCFFFPILGPDESWKESMSVGHWSLLCTRELYDCLSCTCEQSLSASIQQLGTAIESRKRSRINDGCPTELSLSFIGRA